jgi:hypothetical protein
MPEASILHRRPGTQSSGRLWWATVYAEQRREVFSGGMADDMDTVVAVLRRVSERDPTVLDDPDERWDFERAVSRLEARRPFLSDGFERTVVNVALRQAFAATGSSP